MDLIHSTARIWRRLLAVRNSDHTVLRYSLTPILYPIGTPVNGRTMLFAPVVYPVIVVSGPFRACDGLIRVNERVIPAKVQRLSVRMA